MKKIIKNGTIVTAADTYKADILIENEKIALIGQDLTDPAAEVVEAEGNYIFPGGIDPHTHLEMPFGGTVSKDDFETGTIAAAHGGTTTVIDFCLTDKGKPLQDSIDKWHAKSHDKSVIDYSFHLMIGEMNDSVLEQLPSVIEDEGITSFKVFMAYKNVFQADDGTLFRTLEEAKKLGALVMVHAENGDVIDHLVNKALEAGQTDPIYHALTRPPEVEGEATGRAAELTGLADSQLYVVHVTCEEAVEAIAKARKKGYNVMGETCPQYLVLDQSYMEKPNFEGAKYVWSPPLREKYHQDKLWKALKTGDLQTLGSDQCSFDFKGQKDLGKGDFTKIPNGGPIIEDRVSILFSEGVKKGRITLNEFVDITSTKIAKTFGLFPQKGTISVGADADLVIFDPNVERTISVESSHMAADYNPFEGMKVTGQPISVLSRGDFVIKNKEFVGELGKGNYLKRSRYGELTSSKEELYQK
ncbi:dihydropyrimidinase [Halobacillus karajensis]|uniref:D-hydantoinase n=1 Tax=Halobacillus karajensis TaxID=195088 RepID=A0A024P7Z1_9BACI|nr:dihydropyrimidinase [Halobacillus karajensis]CDQ20968.1 D-hydantoinase [Halobacillus karajensis]CDQ24968.1 D-hydantoinase [Halobacillus karajensis]CDQ28671.1 D-hydantoinase [Halobacillus karajensis]SEH97897.1 dihydropyrimidinase [Halobacillus karajensis]